MQPQELIIKDGNEEFKAYVSSSEDVQVSEDGPDHRGINVPTVNLQSVHSTIKGYVQYAVGAFRNLDVVEVEKVTLKFNLKIAGKAGIPILTESSAESNFEIQVDCKFPQKDEKK